MAWFKRRAGLEFDVLGAQQTKPAPRSVPRPPRADGVRWVVPKPATSGQSFHVSGEQYRQQELASVGAGARLFRLVRDPANAHDHNAVKVMCDGVHIGFVSAKTAPRYADLVRQVESAGLELWVHGLVKRQANAHTSSWVARIDCGWPEDIEVPSFGTKTNGAKRGKMPGH